MSSFTAELLFVPALTVGVLVLSGLAVSIVMSKRSSGGLINASTGGRALVVYQSSATEASKRVPATWANRTVVVSLDNENPNLGRDFSLALFDPREVPDGTTLTIFNSPASPTAAKVIVQWIGSVISEAITISLGRGQGVTLISQARIGTKFIELQGTTPTIPDLTPHELRKRQWKPWRYWPSQCSLFCTAQNGVPAPAPPSTSRCVENTACSAYSDGDNSTDASDGLTVITGANCRHFNCNCATTPSSLWCTT